MPFDDKLLLYKDLFTLCHMLASAPPEETYEETYQKATAFMDSSHIENREGFHMDLAGAVVEILSAINDQTVWEGMNEIALNPPRISSFAMKAVRGSSQHYYYDMEENALKTSILIARLAFDIRKKSKARKQVDNLSSLRLTRLPLTVFDVAWTSEVEYFAEVFYTSKDMSSDELDQYMEKRIEIQPRFQEKLLLGAMGCYINVIHGLAKTKKTPVLQVIDDFRQTIESALK